MEKSLGYRTLEKGDHETVRNLVESVFSSFMRGRYWAWKYLQNPDFDQSLVAVAENNGKVIGCNHWLRRRFKISDSVEVDSMLAADIAVSPEYRKMGAGRALMQFMRISEGAKEKGTPVIYMFANPSLSKRFHVPTGGYITAPDRTVTYTKVLNWNKVEENTSSLNQESQSSKSRRNLEGVDLGVLFKVRFAPPLFLRLAEGKVDVYQKDAALQQHADVIIVSDVATLSGIKKKEGRMWGLLKALLSRRLQVKGGLRKIYTLYRNLWVLQEALGRKIT